MAINLATGQNTGDSVARFSRELRELKHPGPGRWYKTNVGIFMKWVHWRELVKYL